MKFCQVPQAEDAFGVRETESSEHKEGMIMVLGKSMTRLKRFYAVEFAKLKIASFCDHIWVPTVVKT